MERRWIGQVDRVLIPGGIFLRITARPEHEVVEALQGTSMALLGARDVGMHHRAIAFKKQI